MGLLSVKMPYQDFDDLYETFLALALSLSLSDQTSAKEQASRVSCSSEKTFAEEQASRVSCSSANVFSDNETRLALALSLSEKTFAEEQASMVSLPSVIVTSDGNSAVRGDGLCSIHALMMAITACIPLENLEVIFDWLPHQRISSLENMIRNLKKMCESVLGCRNSPTDNYIEYEGVNFVACELEMFLETDLKNVSSIDGYSHMSLIAVMFGAEVTLVHRKSGLNKEICPMRVHPCHKGPYYVSTNQCHWEAHANELPVDFDYKEQWYNLMMKDRKNFQSQILMVKSATEYDQKTRGSGEMLIST